MNRDGTGKLQAALLSAERNCARTLSSSEEVIVMHSEKIKAKYMKEYVCKIFFFVNLQVGLSQLHYRLTSSQIIFRDFK